MSNQVMSQVHFYSQKPGPFKTASWHVLQDTCKLFLLTCKKVIVNLFTFLFFFLHWHNVKPCEAVVKKCMYKIPLIVDLLQKLWLREGEPKEIRGNNKYCICIVTGQEHCRGSVFVLIHLFFFFLNQSQELQCCTSHPLSAVPID